jgi:hypothetical protein
MTTPPDFKKAPPEDKAEHDAMLAAYMAEIGDGEPDYEERMIMLEQWEMAWNAAIENQNAPMPCGHPARYVWPHQGDSGTTYNCLACVLDGDPQSAVSQQTREYWRASAIKFADKVLAALADSQLIINQVRYGEPVNLNEVIAQSDRNAKLLKE